MTYKEVMSNNILSSDFITYLNHHSLATDVSEDSQQRLLNENKRIILSILISWNLTQL